MCVCVFSDFVAKCVGEEAKYEGIRLLFDGLQQPLLNKQVLRNTVTEGKAGLFVEHILTTRQFNVLYIKHRRHQDTM